MAEVRGKLTEDKELLAILDTIEAEERFLAEDLCKCSGHQDHLVQEVFGKGNLEWCEQSLAEKLAFRSIDRFLGYWGISISKDGNQVCLLLVDNLQEGIAGFGDTIKDAADDFKREYLCACTKKDMDLEKEIKEYFDGWNVIEDIGLCRADGWSVIPKDLPPIARHFYELGLNSKK